ncbi:tetratricopeptide repeat protein [Bacteroidota bacterium]
MNYLSFQLLFTSLLLWTSFLLQAQNINENQRKEIEDSKVYLEHFIEQQDFRQAANLSAKLAGTYWNLNLQDSAIYFYKKAAGLFEELKSLSELASIYTNIGVLYFEKRNSKEAIEYYNKSLKISERISNNELIAAKNIDLAVAYSIARDYATAEKYLEKAMKIGRSEKNHDIILSCFENYYQIYTNAGNEWKAKEYGLRYNHYRDSVEGNDYDITQLITQERQKYLAAHPELASKPSKERADEKSEALSLSEFVTSRKKQAFENQTLAELEKTDEIHPRTELDTTKEKVYRKADIMPQFPGGLFGLKLFLGNTIDFPPDYMKKEKDSIVIEHIILKNGFLVNPTIRTGIHPVLDTLALIAINQMPPWIPGKINNEYVNVYTKTVIHYPMTDIQTILSIEIKRLIKLKDEMLASGKMDAIPKIYVEIGNLYYYSKQNDDALDYYRMALNLLKERDDFQGVSDILINISGIYQTWVRYKEAIRYLLDSYEIKKQIEDMAGTSQVLYRIGQVYQEMTDTSNALEYYKKSLEIDNKLGNEQDQAVALNNIGVVYFSMGQLQEALEYYSKALELYQEMNNKFGTATTLNNIGNVQFELNEYEKALEIYENSVSLKKEINYFEGIAISLYNIGNIYQMINEFEKAIDNFNKSIDLSRKYLLNEIEWKNYKALAEIYAKRDNCFNALKYHKQYSRLRFYISEGEKISQISEDQIKYVVQERFSQNLLEKLNELQQANILKDMTINRYMDEIREQKLIARLQSQKDQQRIALLNKEKEIQQKEIARKKLQRNALILILVLVIAALLIILNYYRQKKKLNKMLKKRNNDIVEKNELLAKQKEEIESQRDLVVDQRDQIKRINQELTDSIHYAKYIQSAVLPSSEVRNNLLGEHFIFFEPRDIVSGDFYWTTKVEERVILAVADCTGHGVPGAFMSMLGLSFLNEIVNKEYITHSGVILRRLRKEVISALQQTGKYGEQRDGMDIALCSFDFEKNELQFSGANNPLLLIRKKSLEGIQGSKMMEGESHKLYEIKGDKMPIGFYDRMDRFETFEIKLQKGDCLYMFSDGFADQFGGKQGKKYMYKRFKELLLSICELSMPDQRKKLHQEYIEWKEDNQQIDDVLVIGVKIS